MTQNFYSLEPHDFHTENACADTEYLFADTASFGEALRCPICDNIVSTMEWLAPYQIKLIMRTKQYGNIIFPLGEKIVIDEYFKNCYEKSTLTGLTFCGKIEITKIFCYNGVKRKSLLAPPQYYVADIKYGSAAIDHVKSETVFSKGEEPTCDYCRVGFVDAYPRLVIDESTWDGTDIFFARGIGTQVTVSQRFKDWWDVCRFNNGKLEPLEECHRDWR